MTMCLLLAAGSSSRMGKPKMLLSFNGKTLLQHTIDEILQSNSKPVVVTGCYHSLLKEILLPQQIDLIENKNWEEGMGSSIQIGMQYINQQYPEAENIIITVCDQPYLSATLLKELKNSAIQTGKGIIAAAYNDAIGTPVLFNKKYFEQLAMLRGQHGAKKIIQHSGSDVETVNFPLGSFDIDTPQDYEKLNAE